MSTEAVLSEILALSLDEQYEVLRALQLRLANDLELNAQQESELDRRIERFEKGEGKVRPWRDALESLEAQRHARHPD